MQRRVKGEELPEPTGGRGNTLVIAVLSVGLLGGMAAMLYSISPETFDLGPRPAAASIPDAVVTAPPMPDLSALVKRIPEPMPVHESPATARNAKHSPPESAVVVNVKKWTGLGGWKGMSSKSRETPKSPTTPPSNKRESISRK